MLSSLRKRLIDKFERLVKRSPEIWTGEKEAALDKTFLGKIKRWILNFIIDPSSTIYYVWLGIISATVLFNYTILPVRAVYHDIQNNFRSIWIPVDYFTDSLNLIDIFIGSRTGLLQQGLPVMDKMVLFKVYISKLSFYLDLISVIPFEIISLIGNIGGLDVVWFRFNRLLKIHRIWDFTYQTENRITSPGVFRISCLILFMLMLIHWNAGFYILLSKLIGFGYDSWLYPPREKEDPDNTFIEMSERWNDSTSMYIYSMYWSLNAFIKIGEAPSPVYGFEYLLMVAEFLGGILIFATIVGNVGSMITNMNAKRSEFQMKIDGIKTYLELRGVSKDLQRRVINWFDYVWTQGSSLDEEKILFSLPKKLKTEIAITQHYETLKKVSIFKDCDPGLLMELVAKLKQQIYSPGDFICRKGDIGREMYIVKRGNLQVVSEDGSKVFATLNEGSVFGEISILNIPGSKSGNRRTANVKSVGYSDLFSLSKNDLWSALIDYPDMQKSLVQIGKDILIKDNLLNMEENKRAENKKENLRTTIERIHQGIGILDKRVNDFMKEYLEYDKTINGQIQCLESRCNNF